VRVRTFFDVVTKGMVSSCGEGFCRRLTNLPILIGSVAVTWIPKPVHAVGIQLETIINVQHCLDLYDLSLGLLRHSPSSSQFPRLPVPTIWSGTSGL
jgi:hypothetical protein